MAEADPDKRQQFHDLYQELIADENRNRMIRDDVLEALREGRSPLVLTERREHLRALAIGLEPHVKNVVMLYGGRGLKQSRAVVSQLAEKGQPKLNWRSTAKSSSI